MKCQHFLEEKYLLMSELEISVLIMRFRCPVVSSSEWRVRVDWTIEDPSLLQVEGEMPASSQIETSSSEDD